VSCPHLLPRIAWTCQPVLGTLTDLALFLRKCPNAPATAPSYIQFEMGCKVLADAAEDNIRISHFIPLLAELRREVHIAVPHLCEVLRTALRERQQQHGSQSQSGSPGMAMAFPPPSMQSAAAAAAAAAGTGDFGVPTTYSRPTSAGSGNFASLPSVESFTQYTTDHSTGPGQFAFAVGGGEAVGGGGGIDYFSSSGCDPAFSAPQQQQPQQQHPPPTSLVVNADTGGAVPSSYFSPTKNLQTINTTASWFDFVAPTSS